MKAVLFRDNHDLIFKTLDFPKKSSSRHYSESVSLAGTLNDTR